MAGRGRGVEKLKKHALVVAGSVALGLGVIGVFVPLLPTTPFLLLAAACYLRGSPRLHDWLLSNRYLGRYIRDYQSGAGLSRGTKALSLSILWLTIGYSVVFVVDSWLGRGMLLLVAAGVTFHIISLRPR